MRCLQAQILLLVLLVLLLLVLLVLLLNACPMHHPLHALCSTAAAATHQAQPCQRRVCDEVKVALDAVLVWVAGA
jgi:hypothetical protein